MSARMPAWHRCVVFAKGAAWKPWLRSSSPFCLAQMHRLEPARPFFDTAKSFFGGSQAPSSHFPVVLLSGFLGAGKTSVLEHLLRQQHGFKLGVIVNDLASVNVDANVLRDAISSSGTKSVSLENGCVCCTAADDLQESLQSLLRDAGATELDAIVVELSGVAEPARVKQLLEAPTQSSWLKKNRDLLVRTVTVVDSPAFPIDYLRQQSAHQHHAHTDSGECDERFGTLLAEQVESADLVLLNKADVATEEELTQTLAMVNALNDIAKIRTTEYGKVKVGEFLAMEPVARTNGQEAANGSGSKAGAESSDKKEPSAKACCAAKTCSSTNTDSTTECGAESKAEGIPSRAETRFGITSFVYSTERVMSRVKLMKQLGDWQKARDHMGNKLSLLAPFGDSSQTSTMAATIQTEGAGIVSPLMPILRSKGILLLDANPEVAYYWSHAGKSVNFSVFGPWPENAPQAQGGFGPRRTELVFIGTGHDEIAIRDLLDSCLLPYGETCEFVV